MIRNKRNQNHPTTPKKHKEQPVELTFLEHFYELRKRLFWVVLTLVVTSALGFQYKDQLIAAVMAPLHGEKLVYLTPAGGFSFIFTLSIYFGALLAIPVAIYHIYKFLEPIVQRASRKFIAGFMLLSVLLASAGAAFGYFVTIPAALNFLANFAGDSVAPNLTAESYLNFVVSYVLGLAVLFQVPLLLFLFDHVRPFPPGSLSGSQRFVIIAATIIAAVITPTPDAFNMMVVAIPLIAIYEVGVVAVYVRHRINPDRRKAKQAEVVRVEAITEDVPTEIIESAKSTSANEPLTDMLEQEEKPKPIVSLTPATHAGRTIDGMIGVRKAPSTVQVPQRAPVQARVIEQHPQPKLARRSIDGLSLI